MVVRGLLGERETGPAVERVASVLVDGEWARPATGRLRARDDAASRYRAGEFGPPYWNLMRSRVVVGLMHSPLVIELATHLLGCDDVLVHPMKTLRVVFPQPRGEHRLLSVPSLHQDHPEFQGSIRALAFWVPLTSVADGDGALRVVPASHRDGVLPLRLDDSPSGWCVARYGIDDCIVLDLDVGDVVVFTALTVHGAGAVHGGNVRVSVDCRYQPADAPVLDVCLSDVGGPFGSWKGFFAQWDDADPLKHYWKGRHLTTARFDDRWERWRVNTAFEAAGRGDVTALRSLDIIAAQAPDLDTRRRAKALARTLSRRG